VLISLLLFSQKFLLAMDGHPIRLSGSSQISTIQQNQPQARLLVSRLIGLALNTASTSAKQSADAACQLSD